jgi:hypothetical protein
MNREIFNHSSGLRSESADVIKKNTSSSNSAVHDMNNGKDFYSLFASAVRQLFSHTGVTTDVYKQYTTACPLLSAAKIRRVFLANSAIKLI